MQLRNDFEDYLQEIFMKEHPMILDDELPDAFNDYEWDIEELIKHGDEFGAKLAEGIIKEVNSILEGTQVEFPAAKQIGDLKAKYLK